MIPQTAAQDPGIPYVLEPETEFIKQYSRGTVEDVYDNIEDDIEEGLDLVDGSFYNTPGNIILRQMPPWPLLPGYYLFKGDWDNCIKYSSQMLGADPSVYVKDISALLAQTANAEDFIRTVYVTDRSQ